jgi:hypothetical protein
MDSSSYDQCAVFLFILTPGGCLLEWIWNSQMVWMWSEDELKCGWVGLHGGLGNSGVFCLWPSLSVTVSGRIGDQFSAGSSAAECNWGASRGSATWLLEVSGRWSTTLARQGWWPKKCSNWNGSPIQGPSHSFRCMWSAYWFPVTNNTCHFYKILNLWVCIALKPPIFKIQCRKVVEQSPALLQQKSKKLKTS